MQESIIISQRTPSDHRDIVPFHHELLQRGPAALLTLVLLVVPLVVISAPPVDAQSTSTSAATQS